jgi:hypothetical protein
MNQTREAMNLVNNRFESLCLIFKRFIMYGQIQSNLGQIYAVPLQR